MPPSVLVGYVALVVLWGSTWGAIKIGVSAVPPFVFAFERAIGVAIILTVVAVVLKQPFPRGKRLVAAAAFFGIVQTGTSWAVIFWSEQFVPSGLVSVFGAAAPIWTAVLAHFLLRHDRLSPAKLVGLMLGLVGTALLVSSPESLGDARSLVAYALLILMTISWAFGAIVASRMLVSLPPVSVMAVGLWAGALVLAPLAALEAGEPSHWTIEAAVALGYLVVFGSCVGLLLNLWLLRRLRPTTVVLIQVLIPAEAILIGTLALGETITVRMLGGAALVAVAVLVNARSGRPREPLPTATTPA